MMKQFLRVKQIADQKFQRVGSSSGGEKGCRVLSSELSAAEKRVDLIRESCSATGKKLAHCMRRLSPEPADRRGVKKIPEAALAQCMEEWGLSLGETSILGMTLVDFAHIQETLAVDLLNYKLQVEENVVEPLQNILNVDVGKIIKLRKQLFKLTSEMDAAKARYQSAQRSSQQATGNGAATAAAKAQLLKEETEDIVSRVDQCRDSLTAEMFNLISREPEMSQVFVKLCQLQLEHHRKAFCMLESALPELQAQIKSCAYQPVFGVPLEEHLKVSRREIAIVIESCICWILESAIEEEGLFRIGGSMIKIKKMKSAFDAGFHHLLEEERDPHNVAGILKLYLRSLPEPLLTYQLYDHWMEAAIEPDHDTRLKSLWSVVNSLPETHFKNLRYLIKFLSRLCQNSDVNKMSIQNVAIVIGPNLIWPPVEDSALGMNMTATNLHSSIVDTLITYCDWFFPGDCEFYVSTPTSPRHIEGFPLYGSQLSLSTARLSNGDSALDSMSSSPTNSSPKSPSPRVPVRPRKKAAPRAPDKSPITRSVSCSGFQASVLARAANAHASSLSVSHENLLNAGYNNGFEAQDAATDGDNQETSQPQVVERRPKPPRQNRSGLPPVAERSRRSVGRPSVPPPDRPDSFHNSGSVSSESPDPCPKSESLSSDPDVLDPEDISISFDSSESESYNECQMSFSDNDESIENGRVDAGHYNGKMAEGEDRIDGHYNAKMAKGEDRIDGYYNGKMTEGKVLESRIAGVTESGKAEKKYSNGQAAQREEANDDGGARESEIISRYRDGNTVRGNEDGHLDGGKRKSCLVVSNRCNGMTDVHEDARSDCTVVENYTNGTTSPAVEGDVHDDSEIEKVQLKKPLRAHISWEDHKSSHFEHGRLNSGSTCDEDDDDEVANTCHFTGGTPTWFDHYGDDKRQSNTLWFNNNNEGLLDEQEGYSRSSALCNIDEDASLCENFRTVIDVGSESKISYRSTVSGMAIKVRVNSETQDTRL